MIDVYVMLLAGGVGTRLSVLTERRAKPAVPFGGKYRIIDFALSNCVNSGLSDVGLLTQYRPASLIDHVGTGATWDMDRAIGGLEVLQPYLDEMTAGGWYQGTADAIYRNLVQLQQRSAEDVLILSGDHVYAMDYRPLIRFHRERRFAATVAVTPVPEKMASQFGIVQKGSRDRIVGFQEKPKTPVGNLASMGIYIFRSEILMRMLREDAADPSSSHDFGKDIFPRLIDTMDVGAWTFDGYWRDIGTLEAYYEANLRLLDPDHRLQLAHPDWPIRTPSPDAPPAVVRSGGRLSRAWISNGARVAGTIEGSLVSPGVVVEEGAVVRESVLLGDVHVERGATVIRSILDKRCRVGADARVGGDGNAAANSRIPELLASGLTLMGKDVEVGAGATVGRNVAVASGSRIDPSQSLADGTWYERPGAEAASPADSVSAAASPTDPA